MARALDRRTVVTGLGLGTLGVAAIAAVPALSAPEDATPAAPSPRAEPEAEDAPLIGRAQDGRLHVMTFNIRLDLSTPEAAAPLDLEVTEPGEADHWPERRPLVVELLRREQPTVLGVQEAKFGQLAAIQEALPEHRYVGYGRHGGSRDEHSALFYDAERLELVAWDQFWLSDTPDVIGSTSWGNEISRLVVWAHLRDRESGTRFAVVNTHLDHRSETARHRSAEAILDLLVTEEFEGLPILVTGDFNAVAEDSAVYAALVEDGPLHDTWRSAAEQLTPAWGTFPNYEDPVEGDRRIDWVLTGEGVAVEQAAINVRRSPDGAFPSDHVPVQALLTLS